MKRRAFVAGMAAVMAAQPSAPLHAEKNTRIGVLYPGVDNDIFRGNFDGFRTRLATSGYIEGRNLLFELHFGEGRELRPIAMKLTGASPDLVLAVARSATAAVHAATTSIPVVAIDLESDPVASRFVRALPQPAGNLTGVFMDFPELAGKWLEILKMIVPRLAYVGVLWDPATGPAQLDAARRAGHMLKLEVHAIQARTIGDMESAFGAAMQQRANGMIALTSPIFNSGRRTIVELAARHRLPTLLPFNGYAEDGGLVSYGPDVRSMYAQVGTLAVKILAGTPPGRIPVERPTEFRLAFNAKTARSLNLTIPPSLLLRADQVID
jgi:putative ABC transport system substrate-binding protein